MVVVAPLCAESPQRLLESSRHRWQIELAFKRLKWLLPLGHPKKTDPEGAKAWLQGEAFVSTLIESVLAVGERSPPGAASCPVPKTPRRCRRRGTARMRRLLLQVIDPVLSRPHGLRGWNGIAADLRERPGRRQYRQHALFDIFSWRLWDEAPTVSAAAGSPLRAWRPVPARGIPASRSRR
ncbi:hypothetical protein ACFQGW_03750 [Xanthomonas theicola]|uniref:hypothetical protein n=1 Tax=Xanthomonas theicola TaxID=56464 RepID=UPI003613A196